MTGTSRRTLLSWATMAPLASASALVPAGTGAATATKRSPTRSELARRRIQKLHLPNVPLLTHEGRAVRFYDELIKGRIVTVNFFYTQCDDVCPGVTANLAMVQKLLGAELGTRVFMYSLTLKPEQDDVKAVRNYRELFHAQPGWTFLTGKPADLEAIRRGIGFQYPDPSVDQDKTQHIGNVRYGNEPLMLWAACPGLANARYLAESISWMVRPDSQHIPGANAASRT
jgi:protein SCO1